MAAMTPGMTDAFLTGAGLSADTTHAAILAVVGGVTCIWIAAAFMRLGTLVVEGRMKLGRAVSYFVLALMVAALIVGSFLQ